jgi:transcriptional regulator with XRE-family HTH domain
MSPIVAAWTFDERLAHRVAFERGTRGWSVADLAARSGVSRAMISKIERGEVKPTASLLARLSAAFQLPVSLLLAAIEGEPSRLSRAEDQVWWTDPITRYRRRALSPASDRSLHLTEVELPPAARVLFPAAAYTFIHQQIWVLDGRLTFREGAETHTLGVGDCLSLGQPAECVFENLTRRTCRYIVAVVPR